MDRERLELVAIACRRGLMGLSGNKGSVFHGFPRAACGPASEILGRLLKEEIGYDGVYVCGQDNPFWDKSNRMLGSRWASSWSTLPMISLKEPVSAVGYLSAEMNGIPCSTKKIRVRASVCHQTGHAIRTMDTKLHW